MSIRRLATGALLMAVAATAALSAGSAQAGTCKNVVKVISKNGVYWGVDKSGRVVCVRSMGQ